MKNDFPEVFRLEFHDAANYMEARKSIESSCVAYGLKRLRINFNDASQSISVGETHWYRRYLRPKANQTSGANKTSEDNEANEHPVFQYHGSQTLLFYQNASHFLRSAPYDVVLNKNGFWKERDDALRLTQLIKTQPSSTNIKRRKMSDIIAEFKRHGGVLPLSEYHNETLSKRFMIEAMPILKEINGVIVGEFFTQEEQDLLDDYILYNEEMSPDLDTHLTYQDEQFDARKPYSWRCVVEAAKRHKVRIIGTETPFSEHAYYIRLALNGVKEKPKENDRRAMFDRLLMQNANAIRMVREQAKTHPVIVHGGAYHMFDYVDDDTQRVYPGIASSFDKEPVHTSEKLVLPFGRRNACTICTP